MTTPTDTGWVLLEVACTDAGHRRARAFARFESLDKQVQIDGVQSVTRPGAGSLRSGLRVLPSWAICDLSAPLTPDVTVSLSRIEGSYWEVSADFDETGTVTVEVTCWAYGDYVDGTASATFSAVAAVTIDGLEDTELTGTGDMSATFTVEPDTATCTAQIDSDSMTAQWSDNNGDQRTLTVTAAAAASAEVKVTCEATDQLSGTAAATFTARPSAVTCTAPLAPPSGASTQSRQGSWDENDADCRATQRGDDQTSYYAKRYTFTLAANTTVDITVAPVDHEDPRPVLYVISATTGEQISPIPGKSGRYALVAGSYIIEAATTTDTTTITTDDINNFTLTVSTATAACPSGQVHMPEYETTNDGCRPQTCPNTHIRNYSDGTCGRRPAGRVYKFAQAIIDGARRAARVSLESRDDDCATRDVNPVTVNQLAALMLAIPIREVGDDPSPMTLSRADVLGVRGGNDKLHSLGTVEDEKRAYWHPGVGVWQIDIWTDAQNFNHAERANIDLIAPSVAEHLVSGLCHSTTARNVALGSWGGCTPKNRTEVGSLCVPVYETIYDAATDGLIVEVTGGPDPDGGVEDRRCRWGTDGQIMPCYSYNMRRAEGTAHTHNTNGSGGTSPLAAPFISFTDPDDGTKYAVFPTEDSGYDSTLIRAVPKGTFARESTLGDGNGWFVGTVEGRVLYVEDCERADFLNTVSCWFSTVIQDD